MQSDDAALRKEALTRAATIESWLVHGAFDGVENYTEGRWFSASDMFAVVGGLGHLVLLPDAVWDELPVEEQPGTRPTFTVVVPLWGSEGCVGVGFELRVVLVEDIDVELELLGFRTLDEATLAWCERFHAEPERPRAPTVLIRREPGPVSEAPVPEPWRPQLSALIHRLVERDYAGLARDGFVRYTDDPDDDSIGEYIEQYPATLVDLPDEAWAYSEHAPSVGAEQTWWVIVPLWTAEEGPSDLSLEATIVDDGEKIRIQIDGAHVM